MSLEGLKMDKEEIRYVWDGLEWREEVYPGWRGGWRTLSPWLAMVRRLGVTVVEVGSHWRLLRKDLDFDGREGIGAGDLEATSYWEFPNTTRLRTQAKLRLTLSQRMPPFQHTHINARTHTHTRMHTHTHTYKGSCLCFLISSALKKKEKSRKPKETSDLLF